MRRVRGERAYRNGAARRSGVAKQQRGDCNGPAKGERSGEGPSEPRDDARGLARARGGAREAGKGIRESAHSTASAHAPRSRFVRFTTAGRPRYSHIRSTASSCRGPRDPRSVGIYGDGIFHA